MVAAILGYIIMRYTVVFKQKSHSPDLPDNNGHSDAGLLTVV